MRGREDLDAKYSWMILGLVRNNKRLLAPMLKIVKRLLYFNVGNRKKLLYLFAVLVFTRILVKSFQ
jgi:hypothetical protein